MKFEELQKPYIEADKKYEIERDRIDAKIQLRQKQIERLTKKRNALYPPSWINSMIKPIAEELIKDYPEHYYEILGPFGMNNDTSIHLYRKDQPGKTETCLSLSFRHGDLDKGELNLIDYSKNLHRYQNGTIGEMNGGNYGTIPLTPETDISDLIKILE